MIRLRGHHLFCMTLFTGHGYDEHFTENMSEIISRVKSDEHAKILLVTEDDSICAVCPNLKGSYCGFGNDNVKMRDHHACEALSITCCRVYPYHELRQALLSVTESEFDRVCGNCSWWKQGFCSYEMFRKNIK